MQGKQFENKQQNIADYKNNPTTLFAIGAVLGGLSCFSRADYNLPLFAFLAVMWNQDDVSNSNLSIHFYPIQFCLDPISKCHSNC